MWPFLGVAALLAAGAFVALRRGRGRVAAPPEPEAAAGPPRADQFDGHLVRSEMIGILGLLEEREAGASVGLDAAARALDASRVRIREAADELETLGLVSLLTPLHGPDAAMLTDSGREWLARFRP